MRGIKGTGGTYRKIKIFDSSGIALTGYRYHFLITKGPSSLMPGLKDCFPSQDF